MNHSHSFPAFGAGLISLCVALAFAGVAQAQTVLPDALDSSRSILLDDPGQTFRASFVDASNAPEPVIELRTRGDMYVGTGISRISAYYPNTIFGTDAFKNGTGYGQVAFGWQALRQLRTGEWNEAFGAGAGEDLGNGVGNLFAGGSSGTTGNTHSTWNGSFNTFLGFNNASNISTNGTPTLNSNTFVGSYIADTQLLGSVQGNIAIGSHINLPLDDGNYQLDIGNLIYGTGISGAGYGVSPGRIGIGMQQPDARFSIAALAGETNTLLFSISASTGPGTHRLYAIDNVGHHIFGGDSPTLADCGTGSSIQGNDSRGRFTVGTVSHKKCTVVFAHPWATAPVCQVTKESGAFRDYRVTPTAASFTLTAADGIVNDTFSYSCDAFE